MGTTRFLNIAQGQTHTGQPTFLQSVITEGALDWQAPANESLNVRLGDNAGATAWNIEDSGGVVVASIDSDGNITSTSALHANDDVEISLGNTVAAPNAQFIWETADANANALILSLPNGGATDVPVFVIGDASLVNRDVGFFNGITDPSLALLSTDESDFLRLSHNNTNASYTTNIGGHAFIHDVQTSGAPSVLTVTGAAHTGMTASTEVNAVFMNLAQTRQWATGALATQREVRLGAPTYAFVGASTLTTAQTLSISGAPVAGTNATITNANTLSLGSYTASATNSVSCAIVTPGIANGFGAMTTLGTLSVTGPGSNVSLGNQTSTLTNLNHLVVDTVTYDSTTNVRTVTVGNAAVFRAPSSGTNVNFNAVNVLNLGAALTHTSAAGFTYNTIAIPNHTLTLTGVTNPTSTPAVSGVNVGQITISNAAIATTTAAGVYVTGAPVAAGGGSITNAYSIFADAGAVRFDDHVQWGAGTAITAGNYSVGRDADGTNQLHLNVPTGASFEWSVNDVAEVTLNATTLNLGTNALFLGDDTNIQIGNTAAAPDCQIQYDTTPTNESLQIGVSNESRVLVICENADIGTNFSKGAQTNPTLYIQSADAATTADSVFLFHDQTDGNIGTQAGELILSPAGEVVKIDATTALEGPTGATFNIRASTGQLLELEVEGGNLFLQIGGSTGSLLQNWIKATAGTFLRMDDDVLLDFGGSNDASMLFETADANANALLLALPNGDATNVPVFVIGDQTADNADLGFFNGVTAPTVAILSDDILSYIRFSHNGTNAVYDTNEGAHTFTQSALAAGTPGAMVVTGAAHTGLTASTEVVGINLNQSATKQWATGALVSQRELIVQAPTYGFVGASTLSGAVTMAINRGPTAGTNATITASTALSLGLAGTTVTAGSHILLQCTPVDTAAGVGGTTTWTGLNVSSTGTVSLGDQTATLTNLSSVRLPIVTYASTTNTRTVTNPATLYIEGAPASGGNITFSNGPYSLWVDGGPTRLDGTLSLTSSATTLGSGVTTFAVSSSFMVITGDAGANTIATITGGTNGTRLTLLFVDALVTITDNNTHAANSVDLSAAFTSADDTILELVSDGTSWYEVGRSAN